jgi:hypothetical protein
VTRRLEVADGTFAAVAPEAVLGPEAISLPVGCLVTRITIEMSAATATVVAMTEPVSDET